MTANTVSSDRSMTYPLTVGTDLQLAGRSVRVHAFEPGESGLIEVVLDGGDRLVRLPLMNVVATLMEQRPEPLDAPSATPLLDELPPARRERILRRYADLLQVRTGSPSGDPEGDRAKGTLDPRYDVRATTQADRLAAKSAELKARGESSSSVSTLKRDLARTVNGPEGLIHGSTLRTRPVVDQVGVDVIDVLTRFLAGERGRARLSNRKLAAKARAALLRAGLGDELSEYQLGRLLGELSRSEHLHLEAKARERHGLKPDRLYARRRVSRPGEIVQIDATQTNIHVFDPQAGWAQACILTGIDVFTRCIVALRVILGRPCSRDVAMLLLDMSRPTVTRSGWPFELALPHGVPRLVSVVKEPVVPDQLLGEKPALAPSVIVMDHGRENDSKHLLAAAARLGVEVVFCPPRAAHAKGIIESFFRQLSELQSVLPGFKGANVANHPAGVEDDAMLTCGDLHDALWQYILTIYHHSAQKSLAEFHGSARPLTPAGVYRAAICAGGSIALPTDPMRVMLAMSTKTCLLQEYGLNVDGRHYNSAELRDLRSYAQAGIGTPARRLVVHYDRYDINRVFVRHPTTSQWLCVPRVGVDHTVTGPCSEMWEHAVRSLGLSVSDAPLTEHQIQLRTAELHNLWSDEAMADPRLIRLAALERSRASHLAHDLQDLSPEFLRLAYGETTEPLDIPPPSAADDPFDEPDELDDGELFDLDDIDADGFA